MDINTMIDSYTNWLKKEITISSYGEYQELTIPFLDRFNDYLQIYVKEEKNGNILLTDDGHIINNLISSGMCFKSGSKRKIALDKIIKKYSLYITENNEITAIADSGNFPQKTHMLVQGMLEIDNLFEIN